MKFNSSLLANYAKSWKGQYTKPSLETQHRTLMNASSIISQNSSALCMQLKCYKWITLGKRTMKCMYLRGYHMVNVLTFYFPYY